MVSVDQIRELADGIQAQEGGGRGRSAEPFEVRNERLLNEAMEDFQSLESEVQNTVLETVQSFRTQKAVQTLLYGGEYVEDDEVVFEVSEDEAVFPDAHRNHSKSRSSRFHNPNTGEYLNKASDITPWEEPPEDSDFNTHSDYVREETEYVEEVFHAPMLVVLADSLDSPVRWNPRT